MTHQVTAARITRQAPAERRDFIGRLLLTGIEYTDARPWFGIVGAAVTALLGALAIARWLS